jgi:hypothetical protein
VRICKHAGINHEPSLGLLAERNAKHETARRLQPSLKAAMAVPKREAYFCPFDEGARSLLIFSYRRRHDQEIAVNRSGCAFATNGYITVMSYGILGSGIG